MRTRFVVAVSLVAALARAQSTPCANGSAPYGSLGFQWLHCPGGGPCWMSDSDSSRWFDLAVIPLVRVVDPAGPAAGILRDGDAILAVDGHVSTSALGGRTLGAVAPGRMVQLRIERDGIVREVRIRATPSCRPIGLAVNWATDSAQFQQILSGAHRLSAELPNGPRPRATPTKTRQQTPRLDLEIEGPTPQLLVDPKTGVVTLVIGATRVRIIPKPSSRD